MRKVRERVETDIVLSTYFTIKKQIDYTKGMGIVDFGAYGTNLVEMRFFPTDILFRCSIGWGKIP